MFDLRKYSTNIAVITDSGVVLDYKDLQREVDNFYNAVSQKGFLFCLCENTLASLIGYVACVDKGIPLLLLDATKESELLKNLIDIYQPEYIWLPSKRLSDIAGKIIYQLDNYSLLAMSYVDSSMSREFHPELRLCLTTSGSTGSPKLVRISLRNIESNTKAIIQYLHITKDERAVTSLPMHYSYGMSVINTHLMSGATILLTDKSILQPGFWDFVKLQRATSIAGVPYTYEILHKLHFFQMDLPYMKTLVQAGGKLNVNLVKEYVLNAINSGKQFIVMYGQTEASPRMSYLPWEFALLKPDSIGIAIPGGNFRLIDDENNEITEENIDGELVYSGDNVCLGYAECRADLNIGDMNHGVLYTGDIARRDTDGFYYITGRIKRFVKLFGNRVNLDAIEQLLKEEVVDVACIGVDDRITIFITDASKENYIKKELIKKTGINAKGFVVKVIEKIPTNVNGKVDYQKLKDVI